MPHLFLRQHMVGRTRRRVRRQGRHGGPAPLLELVGTDAVARNEQLLLVGRDLRAQQREVARDLRHGAQQQVHLGGGEGGRDPGWVRTPAHVAAVPTHVVAASVPQARPQCPMCLTSWAIWLLTSTVRGSLSMAVASVSGVQRSSVSTESAIDQPA